MQIEHDSASPSLEVIRNFQGNSKRQFGDSLVPGNAETNHDVACSHRVLQQRPPFRIATENLVHDHNVRSREFCRCRVSFVKLRPAFETAGLGQLGGSNYHSWRQVKTDGTLGSVLQELHAQPARAASYVKNGLVLRVAV